MSKEIDLSTTGPGIFFYSPFAVAGIAEGDDFLSNAFQNPRDVAAHVMRGDLAAFCTGSEGDFRLLVHNGPLNNAAVQAAEFKIRLCLEVRDETVCFRDLYDLMDWVSECPPAQKVRMADGFYRVTVFSSTPESGILGKGQVIHIHFEKVAERPILKWEGVPQLCD